MWLQKLTSYGSAPDIDSTDDETHGDQQLSFFHGFYDHHMFHPLLVYDALSGQLITVLLRPGRAHAAKGAISVLTRVDSRYPTTLPPNGNPGAWRLGVCDAQAARTARCLPDRRRPWRDHELGT
jgi:hypothetical protein